MQNRKICISWIRKVEAGAVWLIPTHGQMGRVLVEVVGGAPHDVQMAAGPRDPVVGRPRAPVPSEKKNKYCSKDLFC